MHSPNSTLYLGGAAIVGGEGWFGALTLDAADRLLQGSQRLVALHFVDPWVPIPLSPEEVAWTAEVRSDMIRLASQPEASLASYTPRTGRVVPPPDAPAHVRDEQAAFARCVHPCCE